MTELNAAERSKLRGRVRRRELMFVVGAFFGPLLRVLALFMLLGAAFVVAAWWTLQPDADPVPPTWMLGAALAYAGYMAVLPALYAGVTNFVWRLAGLWVVLPMFLMPAGLGFSFWMFWEELTASAQAWLAALQQAMESHHLLDAIPNPFEGMAGISALIQLPMIFGRAGEAFFDARVLAQLQAFGGTVAMVLALGVAPGVLGSILAVVHGYERGYRKRHAEELSKLAP